MDPQDDLQRTPQNDPQTETTNTCLQLMNVSTILLPLFHKNHKKSVQGNYFPYLFPPEGNFDIDAGDGGGGWGPFRTPKIHKKKKTIIKTTFVFMFFPRKGTLTLTLGMGGAHVGPPKSPTISNK